MFHRVLGLLVALLVCYAGCGDGDGDTGASATATRPPTVTATPNPNAPSVERGLQLLAAGDLRAANSEFSGAAAADPSDDRATLYHAVTRVAAKAIDDPQLATLLQRGQVNVSGDSHDICGLRVERPDEVPEGAPRSQEILDTVRAVLLPEIMAARASVRGISANVNIQFDPQSLPACLRPRTDVSRVEIDRADVLAAAAVLDSVAAALEVMTAYNGDVDLRAAAMSSRQALFESEPQLLTIRFADRLSAARSLADAALSGFIQAIDVITAETDNQQDDLLVITPADAADANRTKLILGLVRQSLTREALLSMDVGLLKPERLNLSRFFSGQLTNLRAYLPAFDEGGDFDSHRFPDPTFGNSLPDLTQKDIDEFQTGGPVCGACDDDADCVAVASRTLACIECHFDCTGLPSRCTRFFEECEDGVF